MIVAFRRPWFNGKESKLYARSPLGVEVPDEYKDILPSTAKILSAAKAKTVRAKAKADEAAAPKEPETLSELAKILPNPIEIIEGKG